MSNANIQSAKIGNRSRTVVEVDRLKVTLSQINDMKHMSVVGRGNVRQVKTIARAIHKAIQ
ncbi:hypothetical protein HA41_00635 [Pantoea conspicua]|uniref:Uncharacterized protein n=1 Tax=Pantoea conspicua TaxID=472705 RepID=A0A1X1C2R3_9GAMM|nr:hypothetical protein [Pantoea conspicua]ORM55972.1 hypothetical protein HA41_00635 [Pantoea conspicua]